MHWSININKSIRFLFIPIHSINNLRLLLGLKSRALRLLDYEISNLLKLYSQK